MQIKQEPVRGGKRNSNREAACLSRTVRIWDRGRIITTMLMRQEKNEAIVWFRCGFLMGKCPWARDYMSFISALHSLDMSVSQSGDTVALCLGYREVLWAGLWAIRARTGVAKIGRCMIKNAPTSQVLPKTSSSLFVSVLRILFCFFVFS